MRTLLCAALVVAACAPGEKTGTPASSAATGPAAKYTGTWDGRSYRTPSDTGVPWQVIMARVADGTLRGTLLYPGVRNATPVAIRVREVSDTSIVEELGPYHSMVADKDVVTRAVGRVTGDSLNGTFEMRPPGGGAVIMTGTFRAKKVAP
jgi:hypothetical protein